MSLLHRIGPAVCAGPLLFVSLAGSAGAAPVSHTGLAAPQARFAVALPLRDEAALEKLLTQLQDPSSPQYHKWLTPAQFAARFAPTAAAKAAVARELAAAGFTVRIGSQDVFAHGPQAAAERYFHTDFALRSPDGISRAVFTPRTQLQRSPLLRSQNAHVIGLDGLPEFRSQSHFEPDRRILPQSYYGPRGPYFATDLKEAYSYPSYTIATGSNASIGIISSSPVVNSDYEEYLYYIQDLTPAHKFPTVDEFPIDGGGQYNASGGATGEATLDVEMAAGSAPGAVIGIFNVPTLTDGDLLEGYDVAVQSGVDIVSSSIGGCEKQYANQLGLWMEDALHGVFAEGSAYGVTFVAASGDNGALECGSTDTSASLGVLAPANDPLVIGVGGTTQLNTSYVAKSAVSTYASETSYATAFTGHGGAVWGSDGGYSVLYARPSYQSGFVTSAGRGVPDVSMHMGGPASNDSTDWFYEGGSWGQVEGTSAAAPEFAGLLALRVQLTKARQGDLHAFLYSSAKKAGAFRTGIRGTNGYYSTNASLWDPVLGLGTPYGRVIAGVPTAALAGTPFTASNP
jgi:subtilase family serine protease